MQLKTQNEKRGYEEYSCKIVKSGEYTEVYIYHDKVFKRRTEETKKCIKIINEWDNTVFEKDDLNTGDMQVENNVIKKDVDLKRSQRRLKRLINSNLNCNSNYKDKFLTLTCPNLKDRDKACRYFKSFIKNLKYNHGNEIEYIAVMEIQDGERLEKKENATQDIHFHVLLFNCPYIPQKEIQNKIWKRGIVDVRALSKYGDIAGYLANYLSKDTILACKGKRAYFPSRGLHKPIEITSMDNTVYLELLGNQKNTIEYINDFYVERVGKITYIRMNTQDIKMN